MVIPLIVLGDVFMGEYPGSAYDTSCVRTNPRWTH
jgi:hypothetical protein